MGLECVLATKTGDEAYSQDQKQPWGAPSPRQASMLAYWTQAELPEQRDSHRKSLRSGINSFMASVFQVVVGLGRLSI
jgi:hypothetical protein